MGKLFRQQLKSKKNWTSTENRLYEEKEHHIYLRYPYFDENTEKWKYPEIKTGDKLPATQFDNAKGVVSGRIGKAIKVKNRLIEIEKQFNTLMEDYNKQNLPITRDFGEKVLAKALLESEGKKKLNKEEKEIGTLAAFMEKRFIPEMGKVKYKHNGVTKVGFAPNRAGNLKSMCEKFINYTKETGNNPFLALINADDLQSYENYLRDNLIHGEGAIRTDMSAICAILNHARNHFKLPVNKDFKDGYSVPTPPRKKSTEIFTLSKQEIKGIRNLQFPSIGIKGGIHHLENARQLFLIQYITALRVSDLIQMDLVDVREEGGAKLCVLWNQKTEKEVIVPVADPEVLDILKKKEFHNIADTNLNQYYKELGKLAELNEELDHYLLQPIEKPNGNFAWRKLPYKGHRYEFIQTHTLRRSRLSILQKAGWSEEMLLSISGHSKAEQLYAYIGENRSKKEIAVRNYSAMLEVDIA